MQRKIVELNLPQAVALASRQKEKRLEWGRGTGKSTVLAEFIRRMAMGMPRGKVALAGSSFQQMLGLTLPSTIEGLERLGIHKNVHFYVGNDRAPRKLGWAEPYQPPLDYANYIHFWTGFAIALVSQDRSSVERRGQNFDGVLGDEAATMDPERLYNEVQAGNRTKRAAFEKCPLFHAEIFVGSTPMTREGLWFIHAEEEAKEHPDRMLFLRANALHNRHNLSADWFDRMKAKAPDEKHYLAEVMNVRPRLTVNGYYPALKPKVHYYSALDGDFYLGRHADLKPFLVSAAGDRDYDPDQPLSCSIDPGSKINWAVIKQLVQGKKEQRTLKSFWRKYPSIIQELIEQDVLPYYSGHRKKVVDLFIGRDANMRVPNSRKTVAEDVADIFRKHGYLVNLRSVRAGIVTHDEKYHLMSRVHEEKDARLWKSRINRDNNRDLIISLENAEAIDTANNKVRKDKRSENRLATVPAQHATHGSDAYDLSEVYYAKVAMSDQGEFRDVRVIG